MDILFIFPPLSLSERYGNRNLGNIGGHLPPFGMAYIAAFLREQSISVDIIDALAESLSTEDILNIINKKQPKVIGFSAMTPQFYRAVALADEIKNCSPNILVIIGGHHASILPEKTLGENPCFDILAQGEGENTALEILEKYKEKRW